MMRLKPLLLLLGLWCTALMSHAQPVHCQIEHFSRELSSRYVETIAQDHMGFIYMGTRNGLCRYDGHEFRFFKSYPGDACRLSHNRINQIRVSSMNNLWCVAHDLRCYLFDPDTERFYDPLSVVVDDNTIPPPLLINQIYALPQGITWLVGNEWAIRVDEKTLKLNDPNPQSFVCYRIGSPQLAGTHVVSIDMDGEGNEWLLTDQTVRVLGQDKRIEQSGAVSMCVTEEAVWLVDRRGLIARYVNGAVEPRYIRMPKSHGAPRNIQSINENLIGICTELGVSIYNTTFNRFDFVELEGGRANRIYCDSRGVLWIFTDREGLFRYDRAAQKLTYLRNHPEDRLLENENVNFWHEDSAGRIFVVPTNGVMSYYSQHHNSLELLSQSGDERPYKGHTRGYLVDNQRNIWCVEVEGVSRLSILSGAFHHQVINAKSDTRAIFFDSHERFWISSRDRMVYLYDNRFRPIGYLGPDGRLSSSPVSFGSPIYCFHEDEDGVVWMGSRFEGLYKLTPLSEEHYRVEHFANRAEDSYSLSDNNIYDIHRDRYGRLWIATYGGGLNLVDERAPDLRFLHAGNELHFPVESYNQLRVIEETPQLLLLGSTNGLVTFEHDFEELDCLHFDCYKVQEDTFDGLLSNDVRDIHYTSDGELYLLSFAGGLSRLVSEEDGSLRFENYTQTENLPSEQVLAMIEDADGDQWILSETMAFCFYPETSHFENYGERYSSVEFYFSEAKPMLHGDHLVAGTSDGFCVIPTEEALSRFEPPLVLTELTIDGHTERRGIGNLRRLKLKPHERDLQLSFAALDYVNPGSIRYAYRLEGVHHAWQHLGKQRNIHFVDLDEGSYTLVIRSTNSNGRWVENDYRLQIEVAPTFWETGWAWLLYLLLLGLVVYVWVRMFQLRSRVQMEQQLSDIKLRFFTDISHELRTPLTLISAPIEMLLSREKLSEEGRDQMLVMQNNTQRLMTLVNQILDFRKIESKKMRLVLENADALEVIRHTMSHFNLLSDEHNIDYQLECAVEQIVGWLDRDKLEKILFNLLSNAFKYTPDGKRIMVVVSQIERRLRLEVIDEGIGIDKKDQSRLFSRFESLSQANLFKPSSGLGLSLVAELVQLMCGTIRVESTPGIGSRFSVELPLEKEAFDACTQVDFLLSEGLQSSDESAAEAAMALGESDELVPQARTSILVVEDNDELRTLLRTILSEEYQVWEAVHGEEGLRLAQERQPDLIISDVLMPVMDGLEMVRRLKEDAATAHLPVIILSAKASLDDRIQGLESGVDDYLPKPFHASYLLARVRSLFERRRELQQRLLAQMVTKEVSTTAEANLSPEILFLQQATAAVERHMDDCEWTIESFAAEMCLSHTALFQKMKNTVGLSPVEFIREVRLKKACQLIESGHHNIATISYMVGFSDPKYFTRVFKKRFGIPPSQWDEK